MVLNMLCTVMLALLAIVSGIEASGKASTWCDLARISTARSFRLRNALSPSIISQLVKHGAGVMTMLLTDNVIAGLCGDYNTCQWGLGLHEPSLPSPW